MPKICQLDKPTLSRRVRVLISSASDSSKMRKSSRLAVAAEVVVEVTDLKPLPSVADVPPVVARAANLSLTTTTSQPYEQAEVKSDIKKVTVKCLRHCMSYGRK